MLITPDDTFVVKTKGNLVFSESTRRFSVVKLRKDFVDQFPLLKNKASYEVAFARSWEKFFVLAKKMQEQDPDKVPGLLVFTVRNHESKKIKILEGVGNSFAGGSAYR